MKHPIFPILAIIVVFLMGAWAASFSLKGPAVVNLIKESTSYDNQYYTPYPNVSIGNGLYDAIEKCARHNGFTSLEGSGPYIGLSCTINNGDYKGDYHYSSYEWLGEKQLR